MPDFITLTCPTCGGKLQITPSVERFACAHCGNEHIVNRGIGVIAISPVVESLHRVEDSTRRAADELRINRLRNEITKSNEEIYRLARLILKVKPGPIKAVLSNLGRVSLFRSFDAEYYVEIIADLTEEEMERFIELINKSYLIKTRATKELIRQVEEIYSHKERIFENEDFLSDIYYS